MTLCTVSRYVYQKAYVEFFVAPDKFDALKAAAADFPSLTYMAVNSKGDFHSNQVLEPVAGLWTLIAGCCSQAAQDNGKGII